MTSAGTRSVAGAFVDFEPLEDVPAAVTYSDGDGRFALCGLPENDKARLGAALNGRVAYAVAALLVWVAALTACGRSSTSPSRGAAIGLRISGPSTIAPGSTTQLSALATYNDGSSQDATAAAQWISSDSSILTISPTGVASAIRAGDVTVTASLPPVLRATQSILVLPPGTFRLSGNVTWLGSGVDGVVVQVTAGIGAGLSSSTVGGLYRLYGVAGDVQLSVRNTSYVTITQGVTVNSNTVLNFELTTVNPSPNLQGTYTLRIAADPACATSGTGALPAIGRDRQYAAMINQAGNQLIVALSGANFAPDSNNSLNGGLRPDGAWFDVNDPMYYYSGRRDLAELLPDGDVYLASGVIDATRAGIDLVGSLNGTIRIALGPTNHGNVVGQCTSAHHSVTFTNRSSSPARVRIRR